VGNYVAKSTLMLTFPTSTLTYVFFNQNPLLRLFFLASGYYYKNTLTLMHNILSNHRVQDVRGSNLCTSFTWVHKSTLSNTSDVTRGVKGHAILFTCHLV